MGGGLGAFLFWTTTYPVLELCFHIRFPGALGRCCSEEDECIVSLYVLGLCFASCGPRIYYFFLFHLLLPGQHRGSATRGRGHAWPSWDVVSPEWFPGIGPACGDPACGTCWVHGGVHDGRAGLSHQAWVNWASLPPGRGRGAFQALLRMAVIVGSIPRHGRLRK